MLYSSYTELSCPSGIMRCNVKELVQLVDWGLSWYATDSNNCNKDRPLLSNVLYCISLCDCLSVCLSVYVTTYINYAHVLCNR